MQIKNLDEFLQLLVNYGWKQGRGPNSGQYTCPYDKGITFDTWKGRNQFFKIIPYKNPPKGVYNQNSPGIMAVLCTITNFQHGNWHYNKTTGYISNEMCSIRLI